MKNDLVKENNIEQFKINNCPYCGNKSVILDFVHPSNHTMYYVSCQCCHASGPEKSILEDAVKPWNDLCMYCNK